MKLALIGDIHGQWDRAESAWFNRSDYDGMLVTGDLPGRGHVRLFEVARALGQLDKPAVFIMGNHDGPGAVDVLREALWSGITEAGAARMAALVERIEAELGSLEVGAWSRHPLGAVDVVVARPHAMDGRKLTFAPYLRDRFGVGTLEASTERLVAAFDACERPIVVLAHNGPAGFGEEREDPWGLPLFGRDNGDPDLRDALRIARERGKQVLAVVTGHMHWNGRHARAWQLRRDGVLYVNAARVPRWSRGLRRHLALSIGDGVARATLVQVAWDEGQADAGRG